jgi:hypothetical protein
MAHLNRGSETTTHIVIKHNNLKCNIVANRILARLVASEEFRDAVVIAAFVGGQRSRCAQAPEFRSPETQAMPGGSSPPRLSLAAVGAVHGRDGSWGWRAEGVTLARKLWAKWGFSESFLKWRVG